MKKRFSLLVSVLIKSKSSVLGFIDGQWFSMCGTIAGHFTLPSPFIHAFCYIWTMRLFIWLLLFQASAIFAQHSAEGCQSIKKYVPLRGGGSAVDPGNLRSDTLDILHYDLSLNLRDMGNAQLSGTCRIDLVALLPGVNILHFDLLALTVDSVYANNTSLAFAQSGESLFVVLSDALQAGDSLSVYVDYHGHPAQDASWGGFYFASGYAYNLGVGFEAVPHNFGRVWFPCFDNFLERSSFSFHVLTTDIKQAYCNGLRTGIEDIGEDSLLTHWQLDEEIPTYLAGVAAAGYSHAELEYMSINGQSIPMWLTAVPGDTTNMKLSFTHLDEAMLTFEQHFGPYRWPKVGYTAVPFNAGAMEHASAIAFPRFMLDGTTTYETTMAHELSHHWWGDLTTCRTAGDMWLNEGWASYCESLFTEALYGADAYRNSVRNNHKDVLMYAHRNDGGRYPVSGIPLNITYGDHVYNKGADVAHSLRGYMGEANFFTACAALMEQHAFSDISSEDLRDFFQQYTEANLTVFFEDWVFAPGFPEFRVHHFTPLANNMYEVDVRQFGHYTNALYTSVPLHITFLDEALNRYTTEAIVGGAQTLAQVQLPNGFVPVHAMLNADDALSLAVLTQERVIHSSGPNDVDFAEMDITVSNLTTGDSVYVQVENHWAQADEPLVQGEYYISPDRWWRVFRRGDTGTLAATMRYYGDSTLQRYSDPLFFEYVEANGYTEDSIVLLYRANPSESWSLFADYELITTPLNNNWQGRLRIGNLISGEYAWAVPTGPTAVQSQPREQWTVYANRQAIIGRGMPQRGEVSIIDQSGKLMSHLNFSRQFEVSTYGWPAGIYTISCLDAEGPGRQTFQVFVN